MASRRGRQIDLNELNAQFAQFGNGAPGGRGADGAPARTNPSVTQSASFARPAASSNLSPPPSTTGSFGSQTGPPPPSRPPKPSYLSASTEGGLPVRPSPNSHAAPPIPSSRPLSVTVTALSSSQTSPPPNIPISAYDSSATTALAAQLESRGAYARGTRHGRTRPDGPSRSESLPQELNPRQQAGFSPKDFDFHPPPASPPRIPTQTSPRLQAQHQVMQQQLEQQQQLQYQRQQQEQAGGQPTPEGHAYAQSTPALPSQAPDKPITAKQKKADEDYAHSLALAQQEDFSDMDPNIIYQSGFDSDNRPIVVMVASNLPCTSMDMDRFLSFVIHVMDKIVSSDYVLVFCNTAASSSNRPAFAWLRKVYAMFNRKYKKNLKKLFIVHPNFWVKMSVKLFKPFVSEKFWKKLAYIEEIPELYRLIGTRLTLPDLVLKHRSSSVKARPLYGIPLAEAVELNVFTSSGLPIVVEKCTEFLLESAIDVEGIFRVSGAANAVNALKKAFDRGEDVDLTSCDPHTVAGAYKLYLRELPDPLFPHNLYDALISTLEIKKLEGDSNEAWLQSTANLFKALPEVNYVVTMSMLGMLLKFVEMKDANKMGPSNLAIVFAPNILKKENQNMGEIIHHTGLINKLTELIILNGDKLTDPDFIARTPMG
eukprot:TRINITY_DN5516_c3_g1_i1.p1 TRINITY_DN5516_c3_g1~~TRINITY_DN5516_c3_g1_i1.p1  ORF type:complete len:654 (+),score=153.37 TRINITY_DN5516_c3_g1_i1:208-2169(+)